MTPGFRSTHFAKLWAIARHFHAGAIAGMDTAQLCSVVANLGSRRGKSVPWTRVTRRPPCSRRSVKIGSSHFLPIFYRPAESGGRASTNENR